MKGMIKPVKKICFIASLAGMCFFNTSCTQNTKYVKEVKTLDSLATQVRKADSLLSAVDTAKIKNYTNHIMVSVELIKMAHKDTMSAEAAAVFRSFTAIRWSLETFMGKRAVMQTEMHKSATQLAHLSHDLEHNLLKADSVSVFYNYEVKRAKELVETARFSLQTLNTQLPLYEQVVPQADSLIERVKKHEDI